MLLKRILTNAMELHVPVKLSTFDCLNNHNSTIEIDAEDFWSDSSTLWTRIKKSVLCLCVRTSDNVFSYHWAVKTFKHNKQKCHSYQNQKDS